MLEAAGQWFQYTVRYEDKIKTSNLKLSIHTDFEYFKKRLLRNVGLLAQNKDKIKIYLQISIGNSNQTSYETIVLNIFDLIKLVKREIQNENQIYFKIQALSQLVQKRKRRKAVKVEFDSEGSIGSIQSEYQLVIPSNKPYKGKSEVLCVFCHRSNKQKQYIKSNGPFFGPFLKDCYMHLFCAIWSPQIYLSNKTNELVNVNKEIKRCSRIVCTFCKQTGGGLGCKTKSCKVTAHFDCALSNDCNLDYETYELICKKCLQIKQIKNTDMQR